MQNEPSLATQLLLFKSGSTRKGELASHAPEGEQSSWTSTNDTAIRPCTMNFDALIVERNNEINIIYIFYYLNFY